MLKTRDGQTVGVAVRDFFKELAVSKDVEGIHFNGFSSSVSFLFRPPSSFSSDSPMDSFSGDGAVDYSKPKRAFSGYV